MSNGYRNGAFALGLVTGIGLALNLVLWFSYQARQKSQQAADSNHKSDNDDPLPYWDGLIGTFVSPSDTLAQWIMATFTITATIVLLLTLRAANRTNNAAVNAARAALESNRIMARAQRPWLDFDIASAEIVKTESEDSQLLDSQINFDARVRNFGQSPATQPFFVSGVIVSNRIDRLAVVATSDTSDYQTLVGPYVANGYDKPGPTVFVGESVTSVSGWNAKTDTSEMLANPEIEVWLAIVGLIYKDSEGQIYWTGKTFLATPPANVRHNPGVKVVTGGGKAAGTIGDENNVVHK